MNNLISAVEGILAAAAVVAVVVILRVAALNRPSGYVEYLSEEEYIARLDKELAYLDRGANCSPTAGTYIPSLSSRGRAFLEIDRRDCQRYRALRHGEADLVKNN